MRRILFAWLLAVGAGGMSAQVVPVIAANGVVNAATYTTPSFPGGSLAQGTLFTIFGSGLGPATAPPQPSTYPLGTTLGGVSIKVTQGSTTVNALPFYVSATQVSAILPSNTPLGADNLVLTYNGASSAPSPLNVVASSVGLFAINSGGFGPGVLQNYVSATSLPVNARSVSAKPGQIIEMYGTGLGAALNPDNQAPLAGNLAVKTEAFVGGQPAPLAYYGRSPCCSGLDQFAFTLPANTPLGCDVPVQVRTAGTTPSNVVTMAISSDGSPCLDAIAPLGNIARGGKSGSVVLARGTIPFASNTTPATMEVMFGFFRNDNGGDFGFNPLFSVPPSGSCTSFAQKGNSYIGLPGFAPASSLNAGTLSVSNSQSKASATSPNYFSLLAVSTAVAGYAPTSFLGNGALAVSATGGDISPFTTNVPSTPSISLTNPPSDVNRSADLPVTWSFPAGTDVSGLTVLVAGANYDAGTNQTVSFFCNAPPSPGAFTVPAYILQRMPPTNTVVPTASISGLGVAAIPKQPAATFTASGLDRGAATMLTANGSYVTYQ